MKVGPSEKLLKCHIANNRNFSGISEENREELTPYSASVKLHVLSYLGHFEMFWQVFQDPEEWTEPGQLLMHNLLLKLYKSNSKEPVVIVEVNVNLIDSFLNVMTCTDICSQGFLAVSCS